MIRIITITAVLLLSVVRCRADDGKRYYVDPDMPFEEAEQRMPNFYRAIGYFLGYIDTRELFLSTIGELSRVADAIVVAQVHGVTDLTDDQSSVRDRIRKPYLLSLDVEQVLAGKLPTEDKRIDVKGRLGERVRISYLPQPFSKVVAFLKVEEGLIAAQWESHSGLRGYIYLDMEEKDEIVEIVKKYIAITRGNAYTEDSYFEFLYGMIRNGNGRESLAAPPDMPAVRRALLYGSERVKTDARRSMVWLIGRYDDAKLEAIRRRPGIDEDLVALLNGILESRQRSPRIRRRMTPNEEEIKNIREHLQSDDADIIREGMRLMGRYPTWRKDNSEWWIPYLKRHLDHEHKTLRLSIAQRLAWAKNPTGIHVLINDGLRHMDVSSRTISHSLLQRLLGENIDFDPRASQEQRREQVDAFRQWWEANKHRYE